MAMVRPGPNDERMRNGSLGVVRYVHQHRRLVIIAVHLGIATATNFAAFLLRFDGAIPPEPMLLFTRMLPALLAIRLVSFIPFRLYEGLWRYTGVWDLRNIVLAVLTGSGTFYLLTRWLLAPRDYPAAVLLMDSILLVSCLGGVRLIGRIYRDLGRMERQRKVLVYGAGDAGEMIVRDMQLNREHEYEPLGFVDDDPAKVGRRIHGLKVLGTGAELGRIIAETRPHAVVVAMPRATPAGIRSIVRVLEPFKVPIQTLPSLQDILGGRVSVGQIRKLAVEDLLERAPVNFDAESVRGLVQGRRVLITGAGGSIGSELARQIAALGPERLVLLDRYENELHTVLTEFEDRGITCASAVIADVTDAGRMLTVMNDHRPELVFHAAAHKHVPLMELNPAEAAKNNVRGTRVSAEAARLAGVQRFVLVSTDKAVNPSSVMGATKRVAEMLIQQMNGKGPGIFSAVRFGNVLGSSGSVIPRFLDQIQRGGPVTVTHPEVRRYFMLVSEAVHLVLQAATVAEARDIFLLEMGEQILVMDLARSLIRLASFIPDEEIFIKFTGLRPGEKLTEDLVEQGESAEPSGLRGILRIRAASTSEWEWFYHAVLRLEAAAERGEDNDVIKRLCELVPSYRPTFNGK
jgi:FlaA1/EpsC-like NDP-sugar epimerase